VGLTDDRQPVYRRRRCLTLDQLFAGAYLMYARYIDPVSGKRMDFEGALRHIEEKRKDSSSRHRQSVSV